MFTQNNEFETSENSTKSNKNYLQEIKWGNYSISQEIAIALPFELKKSESVLPCYLTNYVSIEDRKSTRLNSSHQ